MDRYFEPIKFALMTFPFIAAVFTLPFLVFQYKSYGYVNKIRVAVVYSLLLFLISAYYLVILPLPSIQSVGNMQKNIIEYMQLIPFTFVADFLKETKIQWNDPITYINIVRERAFLQAFFNAMLLMPLGVYCRYYFRKDLKSTVLITFLLSLFFELTQLTGLYGIYKVPYRLFDVDDLMLNTFGGMVGYLLAPKITFFLPDSDKFDIGVNFEKMQVGFIRRSTAAVIDIALNFASIMLVGNLCISIVLVAMYYLILPYVTNGLTIGKWVVGIRLKGSLEKITLKEILERNGFVLLLLGIELVVFIAPAIMIVYNFVGLGYIIYKTIKNDKIMFYERVSGTKNVVAFRQKNKNKENIKGLNNMVLQR